MGKTLDISSKAVAKKYRSGMTVKGIAIEYGTTIPTITRRLKTEQVKMRPKGKLKRKDPRMVELYEGGINGIEIAKLFGCTPACVYQYLWEMGVSVRSLTVDLDDKEICHKYSQGIGLDRLATEYGVKYLTIRSHLVKCGVSIRPPTTSTYDPEMCVLYKSGETVEVIAKLFNVTTHNIIKHLRKHGVKLKYPVKVLGGPFTGGDVARYAVRVAIEKGKLIPQPCEECGYDGLNKNGARGVHAHHPDYNHPLQIIWLCSRCHKAWHRKYSAIPLTTH